MRIKIIVPITFRAFETNTTKEYQSFLQKGSLFRDLEFDVEVLEEGEGRLTIESGYDGAMGERGCIKAVEKAEREGYDGVVIDCFCDSGYHPAREAVGIPVVGAFETSVRYAQLLGNNIGIVTVKNTFIPTAWRIARGMKADDCIVSITSIDMPVVDLGSYRDTLLERLEQACTEAIEKKDVDVLVLGCTGMVGVAATLAGKLVDKGYDVPVVNPAETCYRFMETLLVMGLKQSGIAYPRAAEKQSINK